MNITLQQIHFIAPYCNATIVNGITPFLNIYLPDYEINTELRVAHFLGQCAEESDQFKTLTEYASGKEYEGRTDLGNVNPGDGVRYKGRGILQITGRANYRSMGADLYLDLENHPEMAAEYETAVRTACQYWENHDLNDLADQDNILAITRRINGGTNGLTMREHFVAQAKKIVAEILK